MLTPQEIQEKTDSLERAVFGGYSMGAVEELLEPLQKDYAALYKENAVLKSKMKVLVEKMEEYRDQEDNLNRAILTAQKTADEMVSDAERRCAKMTAEAEQRLRQRNEDLQREIQEETDKVNAAKLELQEQAAQERAAIKTKIAAEGERMVMAKKAAAAFIMELEDRIQQQLSQLERIKQMDLTTGSIPAMPAEGDGEAVPVLEPLPEPLSEIEMTRQIEENLNRILEESAKKDEEAKKLGEKENASKKEPPKDGGDTREIHPVS